MEMEGQGYKRLIKRDNYLIERGEKYEKTHYHNNNMTNLYNCKHKVQIEKSCVDSEERKIYHLKFIVGISVIVYIRGCQE